MHTGDTEQRCRSGIIDVQAGGDAVEADGFTVGKRHGDLGEMTIDHRAHARAVEGDRQVGRRGR